MGNHYENNPLIAAIKSNRFNHIRGRFFIHRTKFHGIKTEQEMESLLAQYDTICYPLGSAVTYTAHFLPKEYAEGWRLADQTKLIWSVFSKLKEDYDFESIGMQYVIMAIKLLLSDYLPKIGVDKFGEQMIESCIDLSGVKQSHLFVKSH